MADPHDASVAENLALGAFSHFDCKAGALLAAGQLQWFVVQAKCPAEDLDSDVQTAVENGWAEHDGETGGFRLTVLGASILRKG